MALEKVAMYQELSRQHTSHKAWVIHNCSLLATYQNPTPAPEPPLLETMVSVFYRPITNLSHQKQMSLRGVVNLIRGDAFKVETDKLRTIEKNDVVKRLCPNRKYKREHFSYATFSGTFNYRENSELVRHSGLVCIDIDHLNERLQEVREMLVSDPATVVCFISPNGDGLKVIFAMDPNQESQQWWYEGYCDYLATTYGLPMDKLDPSCKDVSRACFLPHDPTIFVNPHFTSA